ncbi:hypothetical protein ELY21_13340 [Legionella sp. km535]|uniref:ankyrin repeat domain-containing protein n=1 Tax=Legionella sp. km535 TaxID=2498107 RepID=UPI000F8F1B5D|nr:ankyrin repeat domain-containing protein [Legionella sp. km535]RUR16260.1 hypothetical protein ELY21_13340 [Legionella sp. km535]
MNFNLLCSEIGINADQSFSNNLELLKQWFHEHVSTDIDFSGNETEQFDQYKEVTELYLDLILPETTQDIGKSNPLLDGESVISALASMGFDRVLFSLKPQQSLLNDKNIDGLTPLHLAALEGHLTTIKILLSLGADTCILSKQNQYPLFSALIVPILHDAQLRQNKVKIFNLLKDKGNQPLNHQDNNGNTVLHQMALQGFDELIKETLATDGELAYIKNNHTHYPIHTAILNNKFESTLLLLQVKDGTTLTDSKGCSPLHYAARYSNQPLIEECCKLSINKDPLDFLGRTPLMLAAELGRLSAVQTLIAHGARTDLTDSEGFSVLHYAVKSGNLAVVHWLIENTHVDINAKDNHDNTPLHLCKTTFNETEHMEKIIALLLEHGAIQPSVCNNP